MRLLYDGFWWNEGPIALRQVMRSIFKEWNSEFPEDELAVVVPSNSLRQVGLHEGVSFLPARIRPHGLSVVTEYGRLGRNWGADAILTHNFTARHPAAFSFIQDFMFVDHPGWFTVPERAYFALMPISAKSARTVFSSTETEASRIRRVLGSKMPVQAVGLGIDPELLTTARLKPAAIDVDDFILTVGRLNARKNLNRLCEAATRSSVITRLRPLIIIGEPDGKAMTLSKETETAVVEGRIRFLGGVSISELAWLYSKCLLFAFLSLDEGFGLPPAEARALGAPVLVSDRPVFRETMGSTARFVDPLDIDAISRALSENATNLRRETGSRLEPSGQSWSETVTAMRNEIGRVLRK